VIINEFGEIGLDHLLVESSNDNIVAMSSGCLCCTISRRSHRHDAQFARSPRPGRHKIFRPHDHRDDRPCRSRPVLHTVMSEPELLSRCRLDSVVTVVDGVNGSSTLDNHLEAVKQVAVADRIVLTKLDLLTGREGEEQLFAIIARLRNLNPAARLLATHRDEATAARLFNSGLYDPSTKSLDVRNWLKAEAYEAGERHRHEHHDVTRHDDRIRSFALADERPISPADLICSWRSFSHSHGANMLRMKGIVKVADDPSRPIVLHGVQHVFHPPVRLLGWPDGDHRTRLVFIVKDIEKPLIEDLFKAFTDEVSGAGAFHTDQDAVARRLNAQALRTAEMHDMPEGGRLAR
jgi:G3E family GTPase